MKKRTRAALATILFGDVQAEVRNAQIASFIPTERNIQKLIIGIEPVQSGSGDPSPGNPRPISGWSAADIFREASYDPTASPYVTVSFGQTVYAGRLDVVRGAAMATMAIIDLGAVLWGYATTGNGRFISAAIQNTAKAPAGNGYKANILCDTYKAITANDVYNGLVGIALNFTPQIWFYDGIHTDADLNAGIAPWLNGVQLLYELATPLEITLTPTQIATIQRQVNYVWADCGPIIELIS